MAPGGMHAAPPIGRPPPPARPQVSRGAQQGTPCAALLDPCAGRATGGGAPLRLLAPRLGERGVRVAQVARLARGRVQPAGRPGQVVAVRLRARARAGRERRAAEAAVGAWPVLSTRISRPCRRSKACACMRNFSRNLCAAASRPRGCAAHLSMGGSLRGALSDVGRLVMPGVRQPCCDLSPERSTAKSIFRADRRRVHGAHGGHAGRKRAAVRVRKRVQLPRMAQRARGVPRVLAREHLSPGAAGQVHPPRRAGQQVRRMRPGSRPHHRVSHGGCATPRTQAQRISRSRPPGTLARATCAPWP